MAVVALKNPPTLDESVRAIHGKFAEALTSEGKAYNARLAAGQMLLVLRKRIEDGEAGAGVEWWPWYESKFVRSRRDAERVMALARDEDPDAAVEEEKAEARESMRRSRATNVCRSENDEEQPEVASQDDIVDHAFRLVLRMNADEQRRFVAKIKEHFKW